MGCPPEEMSTSPEGTLHEGGINQQVSNSLLQIEQGRSATTWEKGDQVGRTWSATNDHSALLATVRMFADVIILRGSDRGFAKDGQGKS